MILYIKCMYKVRLYKRETFSSHTVIKSHRRDLCTYYYNLNCDIDIQQIISLVNIFFSF